VQTVFITGAASGIGKHLTGVFLQKGYRVFATDVNEEALQTAAQESAWPKEPLRLAQLDVSNHAQWESVFAEAVAAWDGIDIIMNVAGLLLASRCHETPTHEIDAQVDVNVKGVIYGTRIAAAHMKKRGNGHIINIASLAGVTPVPGLAVYCATKFAVRAYSLAAALELRPHGIHVTVVCPATVQTPMLNNQLHNDDAELYFSGLRILTVEAVERCIFNRVLPKKPLEANLPRVKGRLLSLTNLIPWAAPLLLPLYHWSGNRRMRRRRKQK
jgi:3-oxoacyl-[acyl-carrier protein] reductase